MAGVEGQDSVRPGVSGIEREVLNDDALKRSRNRHKNPKNLLYLMEGGKGDEWQDGWC